MDSDTDVQEPADQQADSPEGVQEDTGSRNDNSEQRIRGLMSLVGKRTSEVAEANTRAEQAEQALDEANRRLATIEAEAEERAEDSLVKVDEAEPEQESGTDQLREAVDSAILDGEDFWLPGGQRAAHTYVDPNSVSRAGNANRPGTTERLRAEFDRTLDGVISEWGWKEPPIKP